MNVLYASKCTSKIKSEAIYDREAGKGEGREDRKIENKTKLFCGTIRESGQDKLVAYF